MIRKRKNDYRASPEEAFKTKLYEENCNTHCLIIKIEVFPTHGGMRGHKIRYIPANCFVSLENQLYEEFGSGRFFLRFVNDNHEPLEEFGCLWVDFENPDAHDDIIRCINCDIDEARKNLKKLGGDYPPGERAAEFVEMATVGLQGIGDIWRLLGNKHEDEL